MASNQGDSKFQNDIALAMAESLKDQSKSKQQSNKPQPPKAKNKWEAIADQYENEARLGRAQPQSSQRPAMNKWEAYAQQCEDDARLKQEQLEREVLIPKEEQSKANLTQRLMELRSKIKAMLLKRPHGDHMAREFELSQAKEDQNVAEYIKRESGNKSKYFLLQVECNSLIRSINELKHKVAIEEAYDAGFSAGYNAGYSAANSSSATSASTNSASAAPASTNPAHNSNNASTGMLSQFTQHQVKPKESGADTKSTHEKSQSMLASNSNEEAETVKLIALMEEFGVGIDIAKEMLNEKSKSERIAGLS